MSEYSFVVDEDHHHVRLDVFVTSQLPAAPSRTTVKKLIENGSVLVCGKIVKGHHKVAAGDKITVAADDLLHESDLKPENIPLDIVHEDESLMIILKPTGLLVHPTASIATGTLVNALLYYGTSLSDINSSFRPGIVHRSYGLFGAFDFRR